MRHMFAIVSIAALLAVGGCKDMNHDSDMHSSKSSSDPKMMTNDACSHCKGMQTATADGKCPECGMKVK